MSRPISAELMLSTGRGLLLAVRSSGTGARLRALGALVIVGLLVWASYAVPEPSPDASPEPPAPTEPTAGADQV